MKNGYASPSSSPPTPPSPLPISVGPGHQKYFFSSSPPFSPPPSSRTSAENLYFFSSSPSPSPPFSPPPSSQTSAKNLLPAPHTVPLAFSMDRPRTDEADSKSSCLKDLLEWLVLRCCNCCVSLKISSKSPP
ncbi:Fer-1-like protein [Actinidia chinensis var. chinensis]|uniref:Fer-1-like protein n=1 Tax=Actinidia chinensis var. chinensis TaxID=1590841 RepID=A0A2R6QF68_ACTCC|nr:Fer-1-like protein [Actinidia chinensis var. chinensis]